RGEPELGDGCLRDFETVLAQTASLRHVVHPDLVLPGPALVATSRSGRMGVLPGGPVRPRGPVHRVPGDLLLDSERRFPSRAVVPRRGRVCRITVRARLQNSKSGFALLDFPTLDELGLDVRSLLAPDLRRPHDSEPELADTMKLKLIEVLVLLLMVVVFGVLIWPFFL